MQKREGLSDSVCRIQHLLNFVWCGPSLASSATCTVSCRKSSKSIVILRVRNAPHPLARLKGAAGAPSPARNNQGETKDETRTTFKSKPCVSFASSAICTSSWHTDQLHGATSEFHARPRWHLQVGSFPRRTCRKIFLRVLPVWLYRQGLNQGRLNLGSCLAQSCW